MDTSKTGSPSLLSGDSATTGHVFLLIFARDGGRVAPLQEGRPVVIGRGAPSDITIQDRSLSRQHARVSLRDGQVWVEDLRSTNGTRVNGAPIEIARVEPGDQVTLGTASFSIHLRAGRLLPPRVLALEDHDRFVSRIDEEVARCRFFGLSAAVLLARATRPKQASLARWCPELQQLLRPVDRAAIFSDNEIEILLPQATEEEALALARRVIGGTAARAAGVVCGVGLFPRADSAEKLLSASRVAARSASADGALTVVAEDEEPGPEYLASESPAMREVAGMIRRVAQSAVTVLILGETGTGKEVVARAIHDASDRRARPMRCINCAAIPDSLIGSTLFGHERGAFTGADARRRGAFEEAEGGTLLLDEVGELSASAQAALLRVLETKRIARIGTTEEIEVDVRIIAATHRDLEQACSAGGFRWDLYYRLNTVIIEIPPLRERSEDIERLARLFLSQANAANNRSLKAITAEALELLRRHHWPGNVRELRNVIERAVILAQTDTVAVEDLPRRIRGEGVTDVGFDLKTSLENYEIGLLMEALRGCDWNQTKAALQLGIPRRTLVRKIHGYGLRRDDKGG